MFNFKENVVMITGAAGNLGAAVGRAFWEAGAHLVLLDRKADRLLQMFPELASSEEHLLATSVDLSVPEPVEGAVAMAITKFGRVDVLVNAIGGFRAGKPVHETDLETWDLMHNLNARSAFIASKAVVPHMLENGSGKIVNVGARPGLQGRGKMAAYSASKSAVIRLTESMAAELGENDINVNCILPGTIDTPQNRAAMPKADFTRWVRPEALAEVILFLASKTAAPISGAAIPVYGKS
jgi:NAD(P)-dependent dehydrogenase (short-subunit alcohol dehydrogenase family)